MIRTVLIITMAVSFSVAPPSDKPASAPASGAASQATASGPAVSIASITRDMLKKTVTIEGTVSDIVTKPSRTRERIYIHTLTQSDARIEVVWWDPLAKKLKDKAPAKGDHVRIRGRVDEYRGKLQVIPYGQSDIRVLKREKPRDP